MTHKILIVEDNPEIADLVQLHLKDIHCDSVVAGDGEAGLRQFEAQAFDLVILDLMLPVMDGLTVCRHIRSQAGYVPIIMLTSKSSELDRVLGLEIGADDYLTKPFSIPELMARVKAQLRRQQATVPVTTVADNKPLNFDGLTVELDKRRVIVADKSVDLTAKEFDLLVHFAKHPGRVYNRVQLLDQVWGYNHEGYEHTVNSHINRLRAKIEQDPMHPRYILTVWGVGYKFSDEVAA